MTPSFYRFPDPKQPKADTVLNQGNRTTSMAYEAARLVLRGADSRLIHQAR